MLLRMDKLVSGCIRSPQTLIQNFLDNIFQGVEDNIVPIPLHHVVSNRSCLKNKSISTILVICLNTCILNLKTH